MSTVGKISYHFVQGASLEELEDRGRDLRENGWERVGEPRPVRIKALGRGSRICYSQTYSRMSETARTCERVVTQHFQPRTACEHFAQFYDTENSLLENLKSYVMEALAQGESAVVIATPDKVQRLDRRLAAEGYDVDQRRSSGSYVTLDAQATLDRFMVDGMPDETLFLDVIGAVVTKAREGGRKVRAFGEMVALLWAEGKRGAALRLEELWHPFCEREQLPLFCAYPKSALAVDNFRDITGICAAHCRVF